jgi:hypothetical protein
VTTRKKYLTAVTAFGALCVLATAAIYEHTDVMERKSAMFFKVTELDGSTLVVGISGTSATGYLSVKDISTQRVGSSIDVYVHTFLTRSGTSGNFRFDVPVPLGVNEIRFGNDKVLIWHRNSNDSQTAS